MKLLIKRFSIFAVFLILIIIIAFYCVAPRKLEMLDEVEVYSERATHGKFWKILRSEEVRTHWNNKLRIKMPSNDFNKYYLLISDGRRITSIQYQVISKYFWNRKVPVGTAVFDEKHYPHSVFVYRIKKIYILQRGD